MPANTALTDPATRTRARIAGVLFILTFVSAIAGLLLYGPVLNDARYVLGAGADTRIALGALCEIVLVVANIGTALALFPILRRRHEALALGYVASRIVESTFIAVGVISLLSVVTLRQDAAGADASSLLVSAQALVAVHDWTFLLGPGFCVGIGNGLLLGYLAYKSGLVPRRMAMLGLAGGSLILVNSTAVLFGLHEQTSGTAFLLSFTEMIWEASLGIYLIVKGGRSVTRPVTPTGPTWPRRSPRSSVGLSSPQQLAQQPLLLDGALRRPR
jgi:hypothetical protein